MNTEQIIKIIILLIGCALFAKLFEMVIFIKKKFTCKLCNKCKGYDQMETINICKNCYNG